jgi:hypothetical protein
MMQGMMQPGEQLGAILEEATAALTTFDLDSLLALLEKAEALRVASCEAVSARPKSLVTKRELLGAMLRSTESNLNLLRRLHDHDAGWAATPEKTWEP